MSEPLWRPDPEHTAATHLSRFMREAGQLADHSFDDYDALYAWSIDEPAAFWEAVWHFAGIVHSEAYTAVLEHGEKMPGATWFPGARLNFAENLLRHRNDRPALIGVWEGSNQDRTWTHAELYAAVARFQHFLRHAGVDQGDRVAGFIPNCIEAVVAMLACAGLGAIWSSCSPDFGFKGVMDRFGQIAPKVLIAADGYQYNGKRHSCLERVQQVVERIDAIEQVVIIELVDKAPKLPRDWTSWKVALQNTAREVHFEPLPFDHPLYILYSSGTTGVPKCIVHGHGGTLLQHAKEHLLHGDLRPDDVLFYFTTCGWMMWNWLVSGLFVGSTLVLYEGSPGYPSLDRLWAMAETHGVTHFGTSPKFLTSCAKAGVSPKDRDLSRLRCVMSTGAPLSVENFRWVYEHVKPDVQLASICGGTDLISCFMLGSPISPVYAGEIQKRGLGMRVEAWSGPQQPVVGQKAELVCTAPFPSMPVGFWNDADGRRYQEAYFDFYPGVWRHGDYVEITEHGGVIVHGRSDATLNPGGVRIGTAEIYRQVEQLDEVVDSLVIGHRTGDDTQIVLFVVLRPGVELSDDLSAKIKRQIRNNATPRHVPSAIYAAPEIPRTISGKKVEIAVTRLVHGETVENRDALKNPEALDYFAALAL